MLALVAFN